jgi:cell division protein FtsI/penicillin-binding protein 2
MTLTKPTGQTEAIMDAQTAQRLADYMQNNVDRQYGAWRFGEYTVGAKSGTAQQDSGLAHSVFTGFVAGDEMPIAFFVIAEHAGVGQGVAMQAAAAVVQNLK